MCACESLSMCQAGPGLKGGSRCLRKGRFCSTAHRLSHCKLFCDSMFPPRSTGTEDTQEMSYESRFLLPFSYQYEILPRPPPGTHAHYVIMCSHTSQDKSPCSQIASKFSLPQSFQPNTGAQRTLDLSLSPDPKSVAMICSIQSTGLLSHLITVPSTCIDTEISQSLTVSESLSVTQISLSPNSGLSPAHRSCETK